MFLLDFLWYFCCVVDCYVVDEFVFFFVKQKTAYEMRISDWSSDVCSSDLDTQRSLPSLVVTDDQLNKFFCLGPGYQYGWAYGKFYSHKPSIAQHILDGFWLPQLDRKSVV